MSEEAAAGTSTLAYWPVHAQPLHRNVVQQLTRRIVGGELKPGKTLPVEPVLAEQFGVSRTVIREAVRVLVSMGLLQVKQGSGMRIQEPEEWDYLDPLVLFEQVRGGQGEELLEELLEVRRLFEVEVAGLAAERSDENELKELQDCLDGMARSVDDAEEFTYFDIEFHERILRAACNRLIREALKPVNEVLKIGRLITNRNTIRQPGGVEMSQRGHEKIYKAIENRDPQAAREAMRSHVLQFERDIYTALLSPNVQDAFRTP